MTPDTETLRSIIRAINWPWPISIYIPAAKPENGTHDVYRPPIQ